VTYGSGSSTGTYRGYDQMGRVVRQYQQTDSVNSDHSWMLSASTHSDRSRNPPTTHGQPQDSDRSRTCQVFRRLARPRVKWACTGEPTATFLYPTPGAQGIRQALKIMNGEKVEKKVTLETMAIDKTKREKILKENGID
jgi:hypothetical protein